MKVIFVSNYYNHHQKALSDALYRLLGDDYIFMATEKMEQERKELGWSEIEADYVVHAYEMAKKDVQSQILLADVVIFGSSPYGLLRLRAKKDKVIFAYYERILKKGPGLYHFLPRLVKYWPLFQHKKNSYLLCASAYTYYDFSRMGLFANKAYKWGYFPEFVEYKNLPGLINKKKKNSVIWAARYIGWKHPEVPVFVADALKNMGYSFTITMVGAGELEIPVRKMVGRKGLKGYVKVLGSRRPDEVRKMMEESEFYLFTSDRNEGWGVVLNESMNSACIPIANHCIGSVPYLIKNGENGFIYPDGEIKEIVDVLSYVMDNNQRKAQLQQNAYQTICQLWNPNIAAERLVNMMSNSVCHKTVPPFKNGPCSRAEIIKDEWLRGGYKGKRAA